MSDSMNEQPRRSPVEYISPEKYVFSHFDTAFVTGLYHGYVSNTSGYWPFEELPQRKNHAIANRSLHPAYSENFSRFLGPNYLPNTRSVHAEMQYVLTLVYGELRLAINDLQGKKVFVDGKELKSEFNAVDAYRESDLLNQTYPNLPPDVNDSGTDFTLFRAQVFNRETLKKQYEDIFVKKVRMRPDGRAFLDLNDRDEKGIQLMPPVLKALIDLSGVTINYPISYSDNELLKNIKSAVMLYFSQHYLKKENRDHYAELVVYEDISPNQVTRNSTHLKTKKIRSTARDLFNHFGHDFDILLDSFFSLMQQKFG